MGFFSFLTQDTERSIANGYSSRKTFTVYMKDNEGNTYKEDRYQGYGNFGGVEYYDLLVKMNRSEFEGTPDTSRGESLRDLYFSTVIPMSPEDQDAFEASLLWPSLSESEDYEWTGEQPISCPDQGFFYSEPDPTGEEREERPEMDCKNQKRDGKGIVSYEVWLEGEKLGYVVRTSQAVGTLNDYNGAHYYFKAEYKYMDTPEFHRLAPVEVETELKRHFNAEY